MAFLSISSYFFNHERNFFQKVKISRMSESFVAKSTAEPTPKRADNSQKSPHKHSSPSPSPSSKTKKSKHTQPDDKSNVSNQKDEKILNGKRTKAKEIGNTASTKNSSKKSNANDSNQLNGTPAKHKLVERTNSNEAPNKDKNTNSIKESVSTEKAFSPRKTRSKASKIVEAAAGVKAKSKLRLPQLDGAHDDEPTDKKRTTAKTKAKSRKKQDEESNSDSDFAPTPQKRIRAKITPQKPVNKALARTKRLDCRVFSTDDENDPDANTVKMNFWVEAYAEKEKKWIAIDPVKRKVDSVEHVRVSGIL